MFEHIQRRWALNGSILYGETLMRYSSGASKGLHTAGGQAQQHRGLRGGPHERRAEPGVIMSLRDNFNINALRDTYDYSCLLARLDKYLHF